MCLHAVGGGNLIVCEMCIIYCNRTTATMRSDRWDVFFQRSAVRQAGGG